ncbi:hypothetical protein N801_10790 [Knoellia aerolata DSM 18566]|uniref:Glycosyltransferase 2-like domain-containing protein n=1 Tax=Knoellia aerolata DSM 18566 TaxID=1385519 RepID=A0A0A0JTX2_9MICO|nr:hypothetical protein N801_10790 [Knoellia aerolata DSM 18566]
MGWDDNLGFYLNFERLLWAVPEDAEWIALSDQDDRWLPDKLEKLVPLLRTVSLATGQARVVSWPDGRVLLESTDRKVVPPEDLLFQNQVTGALSVFRRDLLDVALPFPRLHTVTQLHDHWLGICAGAVGGYAVRDEVVQDYVQHVGNIVGEVATHRGWTPAGFLRRIRELGDAYEGGHSIAQCARACQVQSYGWRRLIVETLSERVAELPPGIALARARLLLDGPARNTWEMLWHAARSSATSWWVVATFLPGIPYELVRRRATRRDAPTYSAAPH